MTEKENVVVFHVRICEVRTYTGRLKYDAHLDSNGLRVTWVDFELYRDLFVDDGGKQAWNRKNWLSSPDPVYSLDEAQPEVSGYFKWDGCMQLDLHEGHFCGVEDMAGFFAAVTQARAKAVELMGGELE
jgi:hypothetical protein